MSPQSFRSPLPSVFFAVATAVAVSGCPGPIVIDVPEPGTCESSVQCGEGNGLICAAGICVLGSCDPLLETQCDGGLDSAFCCKPWELCSNLSYTCQRDPDVTGIGCPADDPTCSPCEVDADCPKSGQFCSAARCFNASERDDCTSSFQCPAGQRCDLRNYLCVPDNGGCNFCSSFAELCCEDGQTCSEADGRCFDIPDAECESDGDCADDLFCDAQSRCAQCDDDDDCGHGLLCDLGRGLCFSEASQCTTDDECTGAQRCAIDLQSCRVPDCERDVDCNQGSDTRRDCNLGTFQCFLPAAQCTETDEPNGTPSTATALTDGVSYAGVLCRDDFDTLSFPVQPSKRYTATVSFGGGGQAGIIASMLNTEQAQEMSQVFNQTQASVQVTGVTGPEESGLFYVRVQGSNQQKDQWSYSVTVREQDAGPPADCTPEGQTEEPNESAATATHIGLGTTTFSRCGTGDVDYYTFDVAALHGVKVTVANFVNPEGNINLDLYNAVDATTPVDRGINADDIEIVEGPEGPLQYWLRVKLNAPAGALTAQTYSVTVEEVARPAACDVDVTEDDGRPASAYALPTSVDVGGIITGSFDAAVRCNAVDEDLYRFTMPPNLAGSVRLYFDQNKGDMALDLLDVDGEKIVTSNVSTASSTIGGSPAEQVSVPGSATESITYLARARLANPNATNVLAQPYRIELVSFDAGQCLASEPSGGDNLFADGRCVGAFETTLECANEASRLDNPLVPPALDACTDVTPGCGRICGNDDIDFYRVGKLNDDQVLRAILDFNRADGNLTLVGSRLSGTTVSDFKTERDTDTDGHIELAVTVAHTTTPKEHAIKVRPEGVTGHQAQPYSLRIVVGEMCFDDAIDDAGSNETPAASTLLRTEPVPGVAYTFDSTADLETASLCTNDVDVYELFSFGGETVTVTLDASEGIIAELGSRPPLLTQPALALGSADASGTPLVFANAVTRQLYVTVKRPSGVVATGPYHLQIAVGP